MRRVEKREKRSGWQRPTLPGSYPPSTIGAGELNERVRDGTVWTLTAKATNQSCFCAATQDRLFRVFGVVFVLSHEEQREHCAYRNNVFIVLGVNRGQLLRILRKGSAAASSPRPLVLVRCTCCHASTANLSNWWSASGLT